MEYSPKSLDTLLEEFEGYRVEFKSAWGRDGIGEVPNSFWETYSALANSDGGVVLLGVREKPGKLPEYQGVPNIEKVRKNLFDCANDKSKVSVNLLRDEDVFPLEYEGVQLLWIQVPRAPRGQRPVFLNNNPLTGTFRRRHEGDYRCDEATVRRMIADASEQARDAKILKHYYLEDIDGETLKIYRRHFKDKDPFHPWLDLDDHDFLYQLGACNKDRETGDIGLTLAGLLMFGNFRAIHEVLPNYILDYRETNSDDDSVRWKDRVTTDGSWSGNVYDFFRKVRPKLIEGLKIPFILDDGQRKDESHVNEALREALVNSLIHADYEGKLAILIEKKHDEFTFSNPGTLRLPREVVLKGGVSDCRNRSLQKMFQFVGAAEQAGSGVSRIQRAWKEQEWRNPILAEDFDLDRTEWVLQMTCLIPEESLQYLKACFGERIDGLEKNEILALVTAHAEQFVTNERLREQTGMHSKDVSALFRSLVQKRFLVPDGVSRWTVYRLNDTAFQNELLGIETPGLQEITPGLESEISEQKWKELRAIAEDVRKRGRAPKAEVETVILELCREQYLTPKNLAELLNRTANTLRREYLTSMLKANKLVRKYADPSHPEQAYKAIVSQQNSNSDSIISS